jgi:hypothetical protein
MQPLDLAAIDCLRILGNTTTLLLPEVRWNDLIALWIIIKGKSRIFRYQIAFIWWEIFVKILIIDYIVA